MSDLDRYCHHCGQKNRANRVKIGEFISEFFDSIFNINSKFFKTLAHLFIPGRLTQSFFQGKRRSYYHPLRMYVVSIVFLFALLSLLKVSEGISFGVNNESLGKEFEKKVLLDDQKLLLKNTLDSLGAVYAIDTSLIDSIQQKLYFEIQGERDPLVSEEDNSNNYFTLLFDSISMTSKDLLFTPIDSVLENSGTEHWIDKFVLKQILKGARDLGGFNKFIFTNLTWLLISLIPFFALILKLIYIRRRIFYLEHLVFLLHLFTALIYCVIVSLSVGQIPGGKSPAIVFIVLILIGFPYTAFLLYYKQHFLKTFIKYILIGILFFTAFIVCFAFFFFITAALF